MDKPEQAATQTERQVKLGQDFRPFEDYSPTECAAKTKPFSPRPCRIQQVGALQFTASSEVPLLAEGGRPSPRTIEATLRLDDPQRMHEILKKGHLHINPLDVTGELLATPAQDSSGKAIVYRWEEPMTDFRMEPEDPNPLIVDALDLPEILFRFDLKRVVPSKNF